MMVSLHLHRLQVVLFAFISVTSANDRWIWSDQRNTRQLENVLNPFLPLPLFPPWARPPPALATQPIKESRTLKDFEDLDESSTVPSLPTARGLPLKSLVVQPLPLDISKLPLENSDSDGVQEVFAPHPPPPQDSFVSSNQDFELVLPRQDFLASIQEEQVTPSLQTKTGHVEALVATPDISQLPLQSSPPSSSFSIIVPDRTLTPPNAEDVFPPHNNQPASGRTAPPPSSTPVPTRVFLQGLSGGLDDSPFIRGDALEEKHILRTLDALQDTQNSRDIKLAIENLRRLANARNNVNNDRVRFPRVLDNEFSESLHKETQNSRDIKIALENLRRLSRDRDTGSADNNVNDRVIFPKVQDSHASESFKGGLHVIDPPRFNGEVPKPIFVTPHPRTTSSNAFRAEVSPFVNRVNEASETSLTGDFNGFRGGRRVPEYAWLWPRETPQIPPRKTLVQAFSHTL